MVNLQRPSIGAIVSTATKAGDRRSVLLYAVASGTVPIKSRNKAVGKLASVPCITVRVTCECTESR
jgi:hypothetical protein